MGGTEIIGLGDPKEFARSKMCIRDRYHARAPFCAQPLSADSISFAGCDRQAVMDAEIGYAARAGLSYWAYVWYEMNDSMMNAWKLHQASACLLYTSRCV